MSAAVTTREVDVSGVVDLDLLQGELDAARGQVEMWCAQRELSMKQQVAAHKTNMMDSEESYVRLVEKEQDLRFRARSWRGGRNTSAVRWNRYGKRRFPRRNWERGCRSSYSRCGSKCETRNTS